MVWLRKTMVLKFPNFPINVAYLQQVGTVMNRAFRAVNDMRATLVRGRLVV